MIRFGTKLMLLLLEVVKVAIDNALNHIEILDRIKEWGFDEVRLNQGLEIYNRAETLFRKKKITYAEQYAVSDRLREKIDELYNYYMKFVKLVRKKFKRDKNAQLKLGIVGRRSKSLMGFIQECKQFFEVIMNDQEIFNAVTIFNITVEKMQHGLDLAAGIEGENEYQEAKKSEAQDMTTQRNLAFQELYDYWSELKQAAVNSCEDRPQLLEMMKIIAYTEGYKKIRNNANTEEEVPQTEEPQAEEPQPAEGQTQ